MARMRRSSVIIFSRVSERTRAISTTSDTGLVRKSSAPASRPRTRSDGLSSAVTMTTGMKWVAGFDFSRRQTSNPSMSGIITSSRIMSHSARAQISSASAPLQAVRTSKYSADSRASNSLTLAATSSTTRIRADIETLPYPINRRTVSINLPTEIGFDKYASQPPLRKLNIHQDEIGTKLAHEIERLETVAGARGLVAMRFQEIAKELHIQLVVLHDQDGFSHPVPPNPKRQALLPACRKVNSN